MKAAIGNKQVRKGKLHRNKNRCTQHNTTASHLH
jgi:hypothetical protein